jgi:hypothetical protein
MLMCLLPSACPLPSPFISCVLMVGRCLGCGRLGGRWSRGKPLKYRLRVTACELNLVMLQKNPATHSFQIVSRYLSSLSIVRIALIYFINLSSVFFSVNKKNVLHLIGCVSIYSNQIANSTRRRSKWAHFEYLKWKVQLLQAITWLNAFITREQNNWKINCSSFLTLFSLFLSGYFKVIEGLYSILCMERARINQAIAWL